MSIAAVREESDSDAIPSRGWGDLQIPLRRERTATDEPEQFFVAADRLTVDDRLRNARSARQLLQTAAAIVAVDVDLLVVESVVLEQRLCSLAVRTPGRRVEADMYGS